MPTQVNQFNVQKGDRRQTLNTSAEKDRTKLDKLIKEKLNQGAAIFIIVNDETFRVDGYDPKTDNLVVRYNRPAGKKKTFEHPANGATLDIVPPTAGG